MDAPNNPDGKLNKVVDNVMYEYDKAKADGKIGCQLIFSDIGTPGGKEFDVYTYIFSISSLSMGVTWSAIVVCPSRSG